MLPNAMQTQNSTAVLVGIGAGFAAGHGWLGLDNGSWTTIFSGLALLLPVLWPVLANNAKALKNQVGKLGAVVVTDKATADALPNNPNVIAASASVAAAVEKAGATSPAIQ